jgi:hypothetical protein
MDFSPVRDKYFETNHKTYYHHPALVGRRKPNCQSLLARFLKGKNDKMSHIIRQIKQDIPQLQRLALQTAYYTGIHYKGINRIRHFILILIVLSCEKNSDLV